MRQSRIAAKGMRLRRTSDSGATPSGTNQWWAAIKPAIQATVTNTNGGIRIPFGLVPVDAIILWLAADVNHEAWSSVCELRLSCKR